jgi:hypothetical protein
MYMNATVGFRVGLGCTGRYMAAIEGFRGGWGTRADTWTPWRGSGWALGVRACT